MQFIAEARRSLHSVLFEKTNTKLSQVFIKRAISKAKELINRNTPQCLQDTQSTQVFFSEKDFKLDQSLIALNSTNLSYTKITSWQLLIVIFLVYCSTNTWYWFLVARLCLLSALVFQFIKFTYNVLNWEIFSLELLAVILLSFCIHNELNK